MGARKLDEQQERYVVLSHLCGVSGDYIRQQWDVSPRTVRGPILERSQDWKDPLVEFYRETDSQNRVKNAIHLYLIFRGRLRKFKKGNPIYNEELFDRKRDEPVYTAVDEDIFSPRTKDLMEVTNLEKILGSRLPSEGKLSPEEETLRAVFGKSDAYTRALGKIEPFLFDQLEKAYGQDGRINLNTVYAQLEEAIFMQIRYGLCLASDDRVQKYFKSLQERDLRGHQKFVKKHLSRQVEELLEDFSPREEKIMRMRYGIGEKPGSAIEKIARGSGRILRSVVDKSDIPREIIKKVRRLKKSK